MAGDAARILDEYLVAAARTGDRDAAGLLARRWHTKLVAHAWRLTGDREAAFAALDRALAERSSMLVLLRVDRAWDSVRDDPRFAAAVRRVGIP